MCDARRPEYGADSLDIDQAQQDGAQGDWSPKPFHVLVEDSDGGRVRVTVNAIGRHDARNLAFERARDMGYDPEAALEVIAA